MLVVVGGHTRNIGKTSVICGVIRALPDWNWTAIKITPHRHSGSSPCTDSGRFLASGAAHAYLVRTLAGRLNEAMPKIHRIVAASENTIIESNSILGFLKPDLCAMVLDGSMPDFKPTSLRFLDRANVLVVTSEAALAWPEVPPALLLNKPRFSAPPPSWQNAGFVDHLAGAWGGSPDPRRTPRSGSSANR